MTTTLPRPTAGIRSLTLAADARLSRTDYTDDQSWDVLLGAGESKGISLQTRYGGRVGLASLVPMWTIDGRMLYQAQTYSRPPQFTGFAPGFARVEAGIIPGLDLTAEFWVMDSHVIGGRFTLRNTQNNPVKLYLDLFGHAAARGKPLKLAIVTLMGGGNALSMGDLGTLQPAVIMEGGGAQVMPGEKASPKIGRSLTLDAGGEVTLRWVHAGLGDLRDSLGLAQNWLDQDWSPYFQRIQSAALAIPQIQTGDDALDTAIAVSYQQLLQGFVGAAGALPYATVVATRQSEHGYSASGDGSDHDRGWNGQSPQLSYLAGLGAATIAPELAKGLLRNYLAVQQADGFIDYRPRPGGAVPASVQPDVLLCPPILARMTWGIFQYTEDERFLREVMPGLARFFKRWFEGVPEGHLPVWKAERQTGYTFFPTFGTNSIWAQNADIRCIEGPDMAAYLLSEATALRHIARHLGETGIEQEANAREAALVAILDGHWDGAHYLYRDTTTHQTDSAQIILDDVPADQEHIPAEAFAQPRRVLVRITGGADRTPRLTLLLQGKDADGNRIEERVSPPDFPWYRGYGVYTSQQVYTSLDRVQVTGLSRVYRMTVQTVDMTRQDINCLLPLWSLGVTVERAERLMHTVTASKGFWRSSGVSIVPAHDPDYDPTHRDGAGGVWPFWASLVGEGLWEYGFTAEAVELLVRLMRVQAADVLENGRFHEYYHSDEPRGLGESGNLSGAVPLHLLTRLLGVRIISDSRVWTGGTFAWDKPVTVKQHGVTVTRSDEGTRVVFPSGYTVTLEPTADWQAISDPEPHTQVGGPVVRPPEHPQAEAGTSGKVIIQVEVEPDDPPRSAEAQSDATEPKPDESEG